MVSSECTKCGHDPAVVKDEPLQMLLAASMLVQRVKTFMGGMCCGQCHNKLNNILCEFALDSKSSESSNKSNTKVGDTL